jgi:hypothetical protein
VKLTTGRRVCRDRFPSKISVAHVTLTAAKHEGLLWLLPFFDAFRLVIAIDVVQEATLRNNR